MRQNDLISLIDFPKLLLRLFFQPGIVLKPIRMPHIDHVPVSQLQIRNRSIRFQSKNLIGLFDIHNDEVQKRSCSVRAMISSWSAWPRSQK